MTSKRRIVLNVIVTYARSIYALALGLFTARWALNALGQTDYGLYGLVGGLVGMVSFINSILASSVGRFYAFSVGEAKRAGNADGGLILCQQWFNTALSIHTLVPLVLIAIGYPVGAWAIRYFLVIPASRIADCIWVWRFSCITCFISMASVPFSAMYTAKQEIAELTLFSFVTTTANAILLFYMVNHPGVWLKRYALGSCIIFAVSQSAILVRAALTYKECKVFFGYWFDTNKYKQLGKFVVAKFWADFAGLFSRQGQALLVNKYLGPEYNASMAIGNSAANHATALSSSLSCAFYPAITNLCGEGRMDEMRRLCFMTCRLGAVLLLVFAIPLALEIDEVLHLWLGKAPAFTAEICVSILVLLVLEYMTAGYWMGIYGRGKDVARYSWVVGWSGIIGVAISWLCFVNGMGMWSVVVGLGVAKIMTVVIRLVYGRILVGLSVSYWVKKVFVPIAIVAVSVLFVGGVVCHLMTRSVIRVVATGLFSNALLLPLAWFLLFDDKERSFVTNKVKNVFGIGRESAPKCLRI